MLLFCSTLITSIGLKLITRYKTMRAIAILIRSSELVIITITSVCGTARGAANFSLTPHYLIYHKIVC